MRPDPGLVALRGLAALAAVVLSGGLVAPVWMRHRSRHRSFAAQADVPPKQAAVVLGARVHRDGSPSTALEDRLLGALALRRAGLVQTILVTGNARAPEHDEPAAMKAWLCDRGVSAETVLVDPAGARTIDSMRRAARVYGIRSAVVCTQRFHLPRALYLAECAGIDAVGLAADRHYRTRVRDHAREAFAQARAFVEGARLGG